MYTHIPSRRGIARLVVLAVVAMVAMSAPALVAVAQMVEQEPNDSLAQAMPVTGGTVVYGYASSSADLDVYRVDLQAGQLLYAGLLFDNTAGNLDLAVLDSTGTTLAISSSPTGNYEEIAGAAPYTGSYYLVVGAAFVYAPTQYVFEVQTADATQLPGPAPGPTPTPTPTPPPATPTPTPGPSPTPGPDQYEPNDDRASATLVSSGSYQGSFPHSFDVDLYRVDLQAGQQLVATLAFDGTETDLDLYLEDASGGSLDVSDASEGSGEEVSLTASTAGSYYVRVAPYSLPGAVSYTLTISVSGASSTQPTDSGPTDVRDTPHEAWTAADTEPNNDIASATAIGAGDYRGVVTDAQDIDVYAVSLAAGETLTADLTGSPTQDLQLYIDGRNDVFLAKSENAGSIESVAVTAPAADTYYLYVWPANVSAETAYTLQLTTGQAPTPSALVEPGEPNGQFITATAIGFGSYAAIADGPTDLDIYRVEIDPGESVRFAIENEPTNGVDLYLFNAEQTTLGSSRSTAEADDLTLTNANGGSYYVVVIPYSVESPVPYTLSVTAVEAPPAADEENGT